MIEDEVEKKEGQTEGKIRLTRRQNGNSELMMTKLVFKDGGENKKVVLCGDYICWNTKKNKEIKVICLKDFADKKHLDMDFKEIKNNLKTIDLNPFLMDVPQW